MIVLTIFEYKQSKGESPLENEMTRPNPIFIDLIR